MPVWTLNDLKAKFESEIADKLELFIEYLTNLSIIKCLPSAENTYVVPLYLLDETFPTKAHFLWPEEWHGHEVKTNLRVF